MGLIHYKLVTKIFKQNDIILYPSAIVLNFSFDGVDVDEVSITYLELSYESEWMERL